MSALVDTRWDCIVVGAGSAGAPLAARLSEERSRRVLLLEAGPDAVGDEIPPAIDEANVYAMVADGRFFWEGLTARVTDSRESERYLVGRVSGGGSSINGQAAVRPLPSDLDAWASRGCPGWSAADLLPLIERIECDLDFPGENGHGGAGPVPVRRPPPEEWCAVDRALADSAVDAGYPAIPDINAPEGCGVAAFPVNRRDGLRFSTARAYLDPARGRANLQVVGDACVERVLFSGRRATGVSAVLGGERCILQADAVVICGGAILSPALLLRSGVGPAEQLRSLGLPVVADLPVGRHLLDHANAPLVLDLKRSARGRSDDRTSNCCIRYSSGHPACPPGDMFIWSNGSLGYRGRGLERGMLGVSVFGSFSEGEVALASPGPEDPPRVRMRLLSDARDLERLVDGLSRLVLLARHPVFADVALRAMLPGCWDGKAPEPGRSRLEEYARAAVTPAFHAAGTCRMGPAGDATAVVDPRCRVKTVVGLRVADASIMPSHVRANTNLTAVMIGERVAELMAAGTEPSTGPWVELGDR